MSGGDNVYINFISSTLNKPYHVSFTSFITLNVKSYEVLSKLHTLYQPNLQQIEFKDFSKIFNRVLLMIKDYPSMSIEKMCKEKSPSLDILVHPFSSKT